MDEGWKLYFEEKFEHLNSKIEAAQLEMVEVKADVKSLISERDQNTGKKMMLSAFMAFLGSGVFTYVWKVISIF